MIEHPWGQAARALEGGRSAAEPAPAGSLASGGRRAVARGTLRPDLVVLSPPAVDDDPRPATRVGDLAVQQLIAELAVARFGAAVLPGRPWFDERGSPPRPGPASRAAPSRRTRAPQVSGSSSLRTYSVTPCSTIHRPSRWRTSSDPGRRATSMHGRSRVSSSTIVRSFKGRPPWVRACARSRLRTWPGRCALSRTQEPSFSPGRPVLAVVVGPGVHCASRPAPRARGSPASLLAAEAQ